MGVRCVYAVQRLRPRTVDRSPPFEQKVETPVWMGLNSHHSDSKPETSALVSHQHFEDVRCVKCSFYTFFPRIFHHIPYGSERGSAFHPPSATRSRKLRKRSQRPHRSRWPLYRSSRRPGKCWSRTYVYVIHPCYL